MQEDFITHKLFLPLSTLLYQWTGIQVAPLTLLVVTVILLAAIVLWIMKNS